MHEHVIIYFLDVVHFHLTLLYSHDFELFQSVRRLEDTDMRIELPKYADSMTALFELYLEPRLGRYFCENEVLWKLYEKVASKAVLPIWGSDPDHIYFRE